MSNELSALSAQAGALVADRSWLKAAAQDWKLMTEDFAAVFSFQFGSPCGAVLPWRTELKAQS